MCVFVLFDALFFSFAVFEWFFFVCDKNRDKQREGSIVGGKKIVRYLFFSLARSIYAISIAVSSEFKPSSASLLSLFSCNARRNFVSFFIADTFTLWRIAANIRHKSEMSAAAAAASSSAACLWKNIKLRSFWLTRGSQVCQLENQSAHDMWNTYTHTHKPTAQCFFSSCHITKISGKRNEFDPSIVWRRPEIASTTSKWIEWIVCCSCFACNTKNTHHFYRLNQLLVATMVLLLQPLARQIALHNLWNQLIIINDKFQYVHWSDYYRNPRIATQKSVANEKSDFHLAKCYLHGELLLAISAIMHALCALCLWAAIANLRLWHVFNG